MSDQDDLQHGEVKHELAKIQAISPYVGQLRAKIGLYLGWIPNEFADVVSEDGAYNLLKNDFEINRCSHNHSCAAAGDTIKVDSGFAQVDYILEALLDKIPDFFHARKALIENGTLFGLGIQRKYYDTVELPYFSQNWTIISKIREVDVRRTRLERNEGGDKQIYWTIWNPDVDQYVKLFDRSDYPDALPGDGVQDYTWYFHELDEQSPYFRGLGVVLYKAAYIKSKVLEYWSQISENWSQPLVEASIDLMKGTMTANLGGNIATIRQRVDDWIEAIKNMRQTHQIIVDKTDNIKIHEAASIGNNILKELVEYLDKKINLVYLGAELTTAAGKGEGSYALGEIHESQTKLIVKYSRNRLQETLQREILADLIYRNRHNFAQLGYAYKRIKYAKLFITDKVEELREQAIKAEIKDVKL